MSEAPGYSSLRKMALPLVAAGVSEAILELTDTVFLARYGLIELAAVVLGVTLYELAACFLVGVADGIQILGARREGEGREQAVGRVFRRGLIFAAAMGLLLMVLLRFGGPIAMDRWVTSAEVGSAASAYLRVMAAVIVVHGLNLAWGALYTGLGKTMVIAGATLVLALTNIALDYCLIFGNLGFPELGIQGAALASLAAEVAALVFFAVAAGMRGDFKRYRLFELDGSEPDLTVRLFEVSWPVAIEGLVGAVRWFLFFLILERVGEETLAWGSIVYAVYAFLWIPLDGVSETTCTAVSQLMGRARGGLGILLRRLMTLALGLEAPILLLAFAVPAWGLAVFSNDTQTLAACEPALRVVVLVLVLAIPGETLLSALSGRGDTRGVLLIQSVVTVPALLFAFLAAIVWGQSLAVVWLFEAVVWVLAGAAAFLRLRRALQAH